eukprot:PITA_24558
MAEENEINIKISRVSAVVPAIPTARHSMFLPGLDLCCIHNPIQNPCVRTQSLIFYKTLSTHEQEFEFSMMVEKLKRNLSLVLVDFYPLAGRLDIKGEDESGRPEIDCNDDGVEFIEASIDMAFCDLEKDGFQHKSFFHKLVPALDAVNLKDDNYRRPFLSVQVTDFQGGGICIGTDLQHVIADGKAFWFFMKCWAERSRLGLGIPEKPDHMRQIFKLQKKDYRNISFKGVEVVTDWVKGEAHAFKFSRDDSLPCTPMAAQTMIDKEKVAFSDEMEISTFHFSQQFIRNLKERARASTSFVAIASHFWRCMMKAREVPEKELVDFTVIADCRDRLKPPLPPTYFGNCLCIGIARTTAKQLLEHDICFAASLIQEAINSCITEENINNCIELLESLLGSGKGSLPNVLSRYYVDLIGSPKLPVYEIDYGWGKPLNVQLASMDAIGGMIVFPGRDEEGSMDVTTRLPRHHMETLKQIVEIIPN